jgi:hypothetical protein
VKSKREGFPLEFTFTNAACCGCTSRTVVCPLVESGGSDASDKGSETSKERYETGKWGEKQGKSEMICSEQI